MWFVIFGLALATINLPTKFEVSISSYERRYKMSKMGWFEVVRVIQGHCKWRHCIERVKVSVPQKLCPYIAPFLRYSEILVENRRSEPTPPLFGAPLGVTPLEFCRDLWHQKPMLSLRYHCGRPSLYWDLT